MVSAPGILEAGKNRQGEGGDGDGQWRIDRVIEGKEQGEAYHCLQKIGGYAYPAAFPASGQDCEKKGIKGEPG